MPDEVAEKKEIDTITFPTSPTYTVPASTLATESERLNIDTILSAIIHWPPGTVSLVDVRVLVENVRLLPVGLNDWLNKDDATILYDINKKIDEWGEIRVEWRNRDLVFAHRVPVDILYIKRKVK